MVSRILVLLLVAMSMQSAEAQLFQRQPARSLLARISGVQSSCSAPQAASSCSGSYSASCSGASYQVVESYAVVREPNTLLQRVAEAQPIRSALQAVAGQPRCEDGQCPSVRVAQAYSLAIPPAVEPSSPEAPEMMGAGEMLSMESMGDRVKFRRSFARSALKAAKQGKISLLGVIAISAGKHNDRCLDEVQLGLTQHALDSGMYASVGAIDWDAFFDRLSKVDWQHVIDIILIFVKAFS